MDGGNELAQTRIPATLKQYLTDHPEIRSIIFRLDNDRAGRMAAEAIQAVLSEMYAITARFPSKGKDYNDLLYLKKPLSTQWAGDRLAER